MALFHSKPLPPVKSDNISLLLDSYANYRCHTFKEKKTNESAEKKGDVSTTVAHDTEIAEEYKVWRSSISGQLIVCELW